MTGVKQRRDSWEVLILEGGEGDRWMGLPNGEAPSHLALAADAKSPYSHPQPPAQAKDTWLWVGRLSAQPPSWSSGHAGSCGDGDRKVGTAMQLTKGH